MKLEGLDVRRFLDVYFEDRKPREGDEWHIEHPDNWHWHASSLMSCPRQQILKRAGMANDGFTQASLLTFELGHIWHNMYEHACRLYAKRDDRLEILATEIGGYHPDMPLAARMDLAFKWSGTPVLLDYKTEHPFRAEKRRKEAAAYGYETPYDFKHVVQLTATAMVAENLPELKGITFDEGRLLYINKASFETEQVAVPITDHMRRLVEIRVRELEDAWEEFRSESTLPDVLVNKDDLWNCKPRGSENTEEGAKGLWCQARTSCMDIHRWRSSGAAAPASGRS